MYWLPHGNPADYKEPLGKKTIHQAFFKSRKQPNCKKAQKKENKSYYKVSSSLIKKSPQFDFSKEFLVRKVIPDGFFKVNFDFCTDFGRRKVYHDLKRFFQGEFIHSIVNIFFRIRIKLFFMKRSRVKRIKELHQAIKFKFNHKFSGMLPVKGFRSLVKIFSSCLF